MSQLRLVGVRLQTATDEPLLLLREACGQRYLPIWIGRPEAVAIAVAEQGLRPPRPTTHDVIADVITSLDRALVRVCITDADDGAFLAALVFDHGLRVTARASDAVALAVRLGVPIHAEEAVLAATGMVITDGRHTEPDHGDQVERFRAFLDTVSPDDFGRDR